MKSINVDLPDASSGGDDGNSSSSSYHSSNSNATSSSTYSASSSSASTSSNTNVPTFLSYLNFSSYSPSSSSNFPSASSNFPSASAHFRSGVDDVNFDIGEEADVSNDDTFENDGIDNNPDDDSAASQRTNQEQKYTSSSSSPTKMSMMNFQSKSRRRVSTTTTTTTTTTSATFSAKITEDFREKWRRQQKPELLFIVKMEGESSAVRIGGGGIFGAGRSIFGAFCAQSAATAFAISVSTLIATIVAR